ncbi:hypothetical protein FPZ24_02145 [Sphingomonas panacisoli]|uniref:STAND NTPase 4 small alpha/beta domain-containing protein n=1 Tax=Sphingomonas panacisoli TaxID=1813879 RepID=A0A5B8LFJ8_9SPHN|nr:hypothetical protein [Sphingomonas panacisoli]QDZ06422.1 hypothetical protein FPZ24_02145 [Sphingomonas panacisoli]
MAVANLQDRLQTFLTDGSLIFLFDNYEPADRRRSQMIRDFAKSYPKITIVLFADERGGPFQRNTLENLEGEPRSLSLHPLKRKEVRELTKRWLAPSGLYSTETFHAVLRKIQTSGLPTTAYVVSMIAWTLERQNLNANINEAALLERFVDAILNKADAKEVNRASLDYTIRESFLAELSYKLRESDRYTMSLDELDQVAGEYVAARGWTTNAANFVRDLINTGILIEVDGTVGYRYRCLREYFLAKYINEDDEYREFVYAEANYLDFDREIDILTGLRRKDKALLEKLIRYTDAHVAAGLDPYDLQDFDNVTFRFGAERTLMKRPESLSDLGIDDEIIEGVLDTADEENGPKAISGDLENGTRPPNRNKIRDMATTYSSITLLSKVVRNSELLTDLELKKRAVLSSISHWGVFIGHVVSSFDKAIDSEEPGRESRYLGKLTDEQRQFVEHFVKVMLPLFLSGSIHSSLGTEKLRAIFESIVGDDSEPLLVRLLTAFLLIDVSFLDRSEAAGEMIKRVEAFAKTLNSRFVSELICEKLLFVYSSPNIGQSNRVLIERFYAETQLRLFGIKAGSPRYSQGKSGIVKEMREKIADDDTDA